MYVLLIHYLPTTATLRHRVKARVKVHPAQLV